MKKYKLIFIGLFFLLLGAGVFALFWTSEGIIGQIGGFFALAICFIGLACMLLYVQIEDSENEKTYLERYAADIEHDLKMQGEGPNALEEHLWGERLEKPRLTKIIRNLSFVLGLVLVAVLALEKKFAYSLEGFTMPILSGLIFLGFTWVTASEEKSKRDFGYVLMNSSLFQFLYPFTALLLIWGGYLIGSTGSEAISKIDFSREWSGYMCLLAGIILSVCLSGFYFKEKESIYTLGWSKARKFMLQAVMGAFVCSLIGFQIVQSLYLENILKEQQFYLKYGALGLFLGIFCAYICFYLFPNLFERAKGNEQIYGFLLAIVGLVCVSTIVCVGTWSYSDGIRSDVDSNLILGKIVDSKDNAFSILIEEDRECDIRPIKSVRKQLVLGDSVQLVTVKSRLNIEHVIAVWKIE